MDRAALIADAYKQAPPLISAPFQSQNWHLLLCVQDCKGPLETDVGNCQRSCMLVSTQAKNGSNLMFSGRSSLSSLNSWLLVWRLRLLRPHNRHVHAVSRGGDEGSFTAAPVVLRQSSYALTTRIWLGPSQHFVVFIDSEIQNHEATNHRAILCTVIYYK